ncbi:MAG: hypothetical protein ABIK92_11950 [Pseudomonadota bacterium]
MKSFLLLLYKKNKKPLTLTTTLLLSMGIGCWSFDLQRLFPSGAITPRLLLEIRILISLLSIILFLLSLFIIILVNYKKDVENENAQNHRTRRAIHQ